MSDLEDEFQLQLSTTPLPVAVREFRPLPPRRWKIDFAFPEQMIAVEVEGGTFSGGRHTRPMGFERDCDKYNSLTIAGWKLIRVTGSMVRNGEALQYVERMFAALVKEEAHATAKTSRKNCAHAA